MDERQAAADALALIMLRIRDGKTRGMKPNGMLMQLTKELVQSSKVDGEQADRYLGLQSFIIFKYVYVWAAGFPDSDDEEDDDDDDDESQRRSDSAKAKNKVSLFFL